MPDPTPDLVALADQVKFLSGDLNRRFEILSGDVSSCREDLSSSVNQLNSRMDTLSTSRKIVFPFKPALGGDWLEGTTSPRIISDGPPGNVRVGGSMTVVPQNLSRIGVFRASARISGAVPSGGGTLNIRLMRQDINGNNAEVILNLSCPLVPGIADLQGDPTPGKEFVDNDRFKYSIGALILMSGFFFVIGPPPVLEQGEVVFESFEIECIVA